MTRAEWVAQMQALEAQRPVDFEYTDGRWTIRASVNASGRVMLESQVKGDHPVSGAHFVLPAGAHFVLPAEAIAPLVAWLTA